MGVIGFNFTKINVEKTKSISGKININNNVVIKNISEKELNFSKDQVGIQFDFEFSSKYEPDFGFIILNGEVIYLEDKKKSKEILDNWKKNKKLEKEIMTSVLNNVLMKCNIESLILSQQINLPPPIPLPKVNAEVATETGKGKK
ncbi:MAG: hypothetical protein V1740_02410 [Candidatus Woesearchaeota archaeon]